MKVNRRTSPQTYRDFRPLSEDRLVRGQDRETWRLWMLLLCFGGIVVSSIIAAAVAS
jgi:hypothetical protein